MAESTLEITADAEIGEAPENKTTEAVSEISSDISASSDDVTSTVDRDLEELRAEFPELSELESVTQLNNPIRYAALRDLGLSPAEAYLLTSRKRIEYDNRAHLTSSVPASAKSPGHGMSNRELEEMREIFGEISDSEINKLYKKVTK